ncbi:MAG: hypothetical protein N2Z22_02965 [Turneriella sp.]|nr:hypothetical protein [Turneriella sp.]
MLFRRQSVPLDPGFDESIYRAIFLEGKFPGKKDTTTKKEKAELWALFDQPPRYNGLDLLRALRALHGIHCTLRIGPRSAQNPSLRGYFCHQHGKAVSEIWFESYSGNISDATRPAIAVSPFSEKEKSRALSQKVFVRFLLPLGGTASAKLSTLLCAYSIAHFLDGKAFCGLVDPDNFLFVPPSLLAAGIQHYYGASQLVTHLVYGFNFYRSGSDTVFFTHGLNRFGLPDAVIPTAGELETASYHSILAAVHTQVLHHLRGQKSLLVQSKKIPPRELPEQVTAMLGKRWVEWRPNQKLASPARKDRIAARPLL